MRYFFLGVSALTLMAACDQVDKNSDAKAIATNCLTTELGSRALIPGGDFAMGSEAFYPDEAPIRNEHVEDFYMDTHEVTNGQFAEFVNATGYVTLAEQNPDPRKHPDIPAHLLVPGSAVFKFSFDQTGGTWSFITGASWKHPEGPGSDIDARLSEPVLHVAYADAAAYADWAGGYIPTAAQWEYAARSGLEQATYAWGEQHPDSLSPKKANTWQGVFPVINSADDGFAGIAPAGCFLANDYGLFDMTGNAWEWVNDSSNGQNIGTIKGGSYLCANNYCRRYRPAARHDQELDLGTNHISFRVAYDLE